MKTIQFLKASGISLSILLTPAMVQSAAAQDAAEPAPEAEAAPDSGEQTEARTMDTNGDGKPDAWDTDGDGKPNAWDMNGNGVPDAFDTNGDGEPDTYDKNEDKKPD